MEDVKTTEMKLIRKEQLNRHFIPDAVHDSSNYDQPHYVYAGTIAGQKTEIDISDMSKGDLGQNWVVEVKSNGKIMGCSVDTVGIGPEETCLGIHQFSKEYRREVSDWFATEQPGYGKVFTRMMDAQEKTNQKIVVLDVKTTGNKAHDEVLQVTMVNANGDKLFDQSFKPEHKKTWDKTEDTSISPSDVKGKPFLKEHKDSIEKILKSAKYVAGYGLGTDMKMLEQNGVQIPHDDKYMDVRSAYIEVWEDGKDAKRSKTDSLRECAKVCHYDNAVNMQHEVSRITTIKHCFNEMYDMAYLTKWDARNPEHLRGYNEKDIIKARKAAGRNANSHGIHRKSTSQSVER